MTYDFTHCFNPFIQQTDKTQETTYQTKNPHNHNTHDNKG